MKLPLKIVVLNPKDGDVNYVQVLFKRYVEYKGLEVIAVEMGYTYPYVRALHGHALQDFERTYTILQ